MLKRLHPGRSGSNPRAGVTLIEILIATIILMPVFVSVMYAFIKSMELSEMSRHSSEAVRILKNKMTEVEDTPFAQIQSNFHQAVFTDATLDGVGVSYVDASQPDVVEVTNTFCWRETNGRVIGEDSNLNGQLDAGEDLNDNGQLDSPVTMTTQLYSS